MVTLAWGKIAGSCGTRKDRLKLSSLLIHERGGPVRPARPLGVAAAFGLATALTILCLGGCSADPKGWTVRRRARSPRRRVPSRPSPRRPLPRANPPPHLPPLRRPPRPRRRGGLGLPRPRWVGPADQPVPVVPVRRAAVRAVGPAPSVRTPTAAPPSARTAPTVPHTGVEFGCLAARRPCGDDRSSDDARAGLTCQGTFRRCSKG